jgi:hypothetical protein
MIISSVFIVVVSDATTQGKKAKMTNVVLALKKLGSTSFGRFAQKKLR